MRRLALGLSASVFVACYASVGPAADGGPGSDAGDTSTSSLPVDQPLGAPCLPDRLPSEPGRPTCGDDAGCFYASEVYVQIGSTQCESRRCVVYHWDELGRPGEASQRVFCTCRCGGDVPGPFCACPGGFACVTAFTFGDPAFRGSYCVPNALTH
jgi:hypothetical protein